MKHRTSAGVAALAVSVALALTACSSDDGASDAPSESPSSTAATDAPTPTAEDVTALEAVEVSGDAGAEPELVFEAPLEVSVPTSRVVDEGDGAELVAGNQVTMEFVAYQGDGTRLGSSWENGTPETFLLGDAQYDLLTQPLEGQKVGTRILLANPSADAEGNPATVLNLVEITDTQEVPSRAEGEAVEPAEGLPTVTLGENGEPSVEIPEGYEAPGELVVQTLIKGDGPEVTEEQSVIAHYTGWTLDGQVFDSSWERGSPTSFSLQMVIPGWTQGIAGQTVGSQVLLVIPSDLAYGEQGTPDGSIPPNSPLVFVVDILGAS
ncbi:FKBP-type peptidyl-prolyl cis-trans isomerase [Isoptericola variabilis]|uniref:peptidylprolyl isomerase n=1 Tax=Isoptericola variabilis (strain 225) TaxID=743718 RepID=F6FR24_ISOV2|nr:FKBP-type peptidyl-prolyl cis-trans isomerase [Isoptericola variabilis]AEG44974.1 peptidylprolyl isomerase FKBP-type [Isoptericola variabilis 225]TWH26014.1 peptidylprolyl isomerase [Isoptericola variabilis J7]